MQGTKTLSMAAISAKNYYYYLECCVYMCNVAFIRYSDKISLPRNSDTAVYKNGITCPDIGPPTTAVERTSRRRRVLA